MHILQLHPLQSPLHLGLHDRVKAIEENGYATIAVDFYHCKYSQESSAGARVGDLYEVCGQAQKSISWLQNQLRHTELFSPTPT
jgi:hypothetical protein